MILVTGATGNFGRATLDALKAKNTPINEFAAMVRSSEKAHNLKAKGISLIEGDYNDYTSLVKAFTGVTKLLFISSNDFENRLTQHKNVVTAAKEAGVQHIIYTSFQRKNETENSPVAFLNEVHIQTEEWIKTSGISYTILQNNSYFENILFYLSDDVLNSKHLSLPAADGKSAWALRADMAEAAAEVLTTSGHNNKVYNLSNICSYSYQDVVDILSDIKQTKFTYSSPSSEVYQKNLIEAGIPNEYIGLMDGLAVAQAQGEYDVISKDLEQLLGRKPTSLKTFLSKAYNN